MTEQDPHAQQVLARTLPVPGHLSPQAQASLRTLLNDIPPYPPIDDVGAWVSFIAAADQSMLRMIGARDPLPGTIVHERREGAAIAYEVIPAAVEPGDPRVYLDIHGGALVMGGGEVCRAMAILFAERLGFRVVSVDYRMPPDHPFPAGLDDCLAIYRALLRDHRPDQIVIGGGSAGGNLAAATVLRARDEGLALPAAVLLITPEIDLTESGDSFYANLGVDRVLRHPLMPANLLYAAGRDLADPLISPLFGDFSRGFPPTLLTAGTRDLFLSNAVRMHRSLRKSGIEAELHIVEALSHGYFGGAPEDAELDVEIRSFCQRHWRR